MNTGNFREQVTIKLTEEQRTRLGAIARFKGLDLSKRIRALIDEATDDISAGLTDDGRVSVKGLDRSGYLMTVPNLMEFDLSGGMSGNFVGVFVFDFQRWLGNFEHLSKLQERFNEQKKTVIVLPHTDDEILQLNFNAACRIFKHHPLETLKAQYQPSQFTIVTRRYNWIPPRAFFFATGSLVATGDVSPFGRRYGQIYTDSGEDKSVLQWHLNYFNEVHAAKLAEAPKTGFDVVKRYIEHHEKPLA